MSDPAVWSAAALLVSAGVAAEGYLAWTFIREWREGRAEERARRAQWKSVGRGAGTPRDSRPGAASDAPTAAIHRRALLACVGLAAAVMTTVAAAQSTPPQGDPAASSSQVVDAGQAEQAGQTSAAAPAESAAATDDAAAVGSAISVQLNLDFTNAYFYRGIRQQDKGLIVQPAARVTTRLVDESEIKFDAFVGSWNSVGPNAGTQDGQLVEDWYESDLYVGATLTHGQLAFTTSYTFLTSPSDAFETVQELGFTLALDDSMWLKAWALKPYVMLVVETGSNGSDSPDLDNGVYLELGIAPGSSFDVVETPITFTFPASVGLSVSDYYQDASGDDDAFGFAQVGAKVSIPLGEPGQFGTWTLNAGVSVLCKTVRQPPSCLLRRGRQESRQTRS